MEILPQPHLNEVLSPGATVPAADQNLTAQLEALRTSDEYSTIAKDLLAVGPSALRHLVAALNDENDIGRGRIIWTIGKFGPTAESALPDLMNFLGSREDGVQVSTARTLGMIGAAAVPALLMALDVEAPFTQLGAVMALGALGDAAAPALPQLKRLATGSTHSAAFYEALQTTISGAEKVLD